MLVAEIKEWLQRRLPRWIDIDIAPHTKYLGTYLGTLTKDIIWQAPMSKWKAGVASIAATGAPPSIAAMLYGIHALPTLSYVAQMRFPPRDLLLEELAALARLIHVPMNTFSCADFFSLASWGSVRVPSVFVRLVATIVRAALCTTSTWQTNYEALVNNIFTAHRQARR